MSLGRFSNLFRILFEFPWFSLYFFHIFQMPDSNPVQISIFNVVAVIFSAVFAIHSAQIVAAVANLVISIFPWFLCRNDFFQIKSLTKPKENPKITSLKLKIAETKRELNGISPTGEFAKYFKKERELNKLNDELTILEAQSSSETARSLKIDTVTRVILQFSSLALLRYVSGITAYCIPDTIFWPFNIIMRFPAIWGNDSCPAG